MAHYMSCNEKLERDYQGYSNPKSFVNFLLPPQGIGEGWGGVKNLRLIYDCYSTSSHILYHSQQDLKNRVSQRTIKVFRLQQSQETRFLALVQYLSLIIDRNQRDRLPPPHKSNPPCN